MRRMDANVTVLRFDQAYYSEAFLQTHDFQMLDLKSISNMNLLCERDTLCQISQQLAKRKPSNLLFLGSGNYHYLSYVLLSEQKQPFSLLLFDHHTDTYPSPSDDVISCGSWVLEALNTLPQLKKVIMVGVKEDWPQSIPPHVSDRVIGYSKKVLQRDFSSVLKAILANIPTKQVYISIDKDVLHPQEAATAWDHGNMRLQQVTTIIRDVIQKYRVTGLDVCGEYPVDPSNVYKAETKEAIQKNTFANQYIVDKVQRWIGRNLLPVKPTTYPLRRTV